MAIQYDELGNVIGDYNGELDFTTGPLTGRPITGGPLSHTPEVDTKLNLKYSFQPNILDNYDAVTYHFKLFIVSLQDTRDGNIFNLSSQVIIAESGVSDLTIDNVEIESQATPKVETGTGLQTAVKFDIIEPSGAGLLDKLYYESVKLGIGNWGTMPVYLQLEFRGRTSPTSKAPDEISGLKWLWRCQLTGIKSTVTHVGTKHMFQAILVNDNALANVVSSLKSNITLTNLTKFKDAIKQLEEKINRDQLLSLIDNYSIPDVFKFKIDPVIENYTFATSNKNSARNNSNEVFENKSATFTIGTGIDKIIDTLLSHTKEYQEKMVNSKTPGGKEDSAEDSKTQMKGFWRIITEVRPIEFDPRRNADAQEYVYFIVYYDIGVLDASVTQSSGITDETSKKKYITYTNKGLLRKKYNYIFTGINDQVIDLDITFNNSHAAALNRAGALYSNPGMRDYGVTANTTADQNINVAESLTKLISLQNNSQTSGKDYDNAVLKYNKAVQDAKLPSDRQTYNNKLIAISKNKSLDLKSYGSNYDPSKTPIRKDDTGTLRFISDVDITSATAAKEYYNYKDRVRKQATQWPIRYAESIQNSSAGQGIETDSNTGKDKLATIFSLAMHGDSDISLIRLTMTIKGDPFWLFPAPTASRVNSVYLSSRPDSEAIDIIKYNQLRVNAVNLNGADNFLFIRFRTPRLFNSESSISTNTATEVETYSGVYKVTTLKSKFEKGKFTQAITCILDYTIKTNAVQDLIEESSKGLDVPTSVNVFSSSQYYDASKAPIKQESTLGQGLNKTVAQGLLNNRII